MWLLLLGLLMRATSGLIGRHSNEESMAVQSSGVDFAPPSVALPYYEPATLPTRAQIAADLRQHRTNAWLLLVASVAVTLIAARLLYVAESFWSFAIFLIGAAFMLPSFFGRM